MFEVMTLLGRGITWLYVTFHDVRPRAYVEECRAPIALLR